MCPAPGSSLGQLLNTEPEQGAQAWPDFCRGSAAWADTWLLPVRRKETRIITDNTQLPPHHTVKCPLCVAWAHKALSGPGGARLCTKKTKKTPRHVFYLHAILAKVKEVYSNEEIIDIDGVKINFANSWVHLRKSNTEPIIRVYSEASTLKEAEELGEKLIAVVKSMAQ